MLLQMTKQKSLSARLGLHGCFLQELLSAFATERSSGTQKTFPKKSCFEEVIPEGENGFQSRTAWLGFRNAEHLKAGAISGEFRKEMSSYRGGSLIYLHANFYAHLASPFTCPESEARSATFCFKFQHQLPLHFTTASNKAIK